MSFRVDLARLDWTVTDLETFEKHLDKELARLDGLVATVQQHWHGAAANAQQAAHDEWTTGAVQMREAVAEMRAAARTAHENYTSAVQANSRMWEHLR